MDPALLEAYELVRTGRIGTLNVHAYTVMRGGVALPVLHLNKPDAAVPVAADILKLLGKSARTALLNSPAMEAVTRAAAGIVVTWAPVPPLAARAVGEDDGGTYMFLSTPATRGAWTDFVPTPHPAGPPIARISYVEGVASPVSATMAVASPSPVAPTAQIDIVVATVATVPTAVFDAHYVFG